MSKTRADVQWAKHDKKMLKGANYELRAIAKAAFYTGYGANDVLVEVDKENKELQGEFAIAILRMKDLEDEVAKLNKKLEEAELIYVSAVKGRKAFRTAYEEGRAMIKKLQAGSHHESDTTK